MAGVENSKPRSYRVTIETAHKKVVVVVVGDGGGSCVVVFVAAVMWCLSLIVIIVILIITTTSVYYNYKQLLLELVVMIMFTANISYYYYYYNITIMVMNGYNIRIDHVIITIIGVVELIIWCNARIITIYFKTIVLPWLNFPEPKVQESFLMFPTIFSAIVWSSKKQVTLWNDL